jgi:tetratricopeptide (TPR) repeat protein
MKKQVLLIALFGGMYMQSFSQSLADAVKDYRYERYQRAEQTLNQLTKQEPAQISNWYWLVRTELSKNDVQQAGKVLASVPADLTNQPYYKIIQGSIALAKGDSVTAKNNFEAAIGTARKKDPLVQIAVAEAEIDADKGNLPYALDLLAEAAKKEKKNPAIYLAIGDAYRKLYNGSEAFRNYQLASELNPKDPVVFYKIGKIYQTQNNEPVFTEYYSKAIEADPDYGPVYYQLYLAAYYKDVNKAMEYLQKYIAHTDPDIKNKYLLTDLYYVSKKYNEAINEAGQLVAAEGKQAKPRIYKLLAYSYDALNNNNAAEENLKKYFAAENDTNYAAKDFELMGSIAEKKKQLADAAVWYEKAALLEKDPAQKTDIARKLASFYKAQKLYEKQAHWMGELYTLAPAKLTNVDIFSWGVANYNAHDYKMADSVFAIYEQKYPEQSFGYYWRARSNAAIDTAMETGIAVPHYEELIKVGMKDSANANTRKWLIQAYGYIAAFKVNKEKQYDEALNCYDKILQLDPGNNDAEKYKGILEKMIETKPTDNGGNNNSSKPSDTSKNQ